MSRHPALLTLLLLALCAAIAAGCEIKPAAQQPTARPAATIPFAARTASAATRMAVATSEYLFRPASAGPQPGTLAGSPVAVGPGAAPSSPVVASGANAAVPAGWVRHTTPELSVALPAAWRALDPTPENLQALYAEAQKNNPELVKLLGSAGAMQGTALWAFDTEALGQAFVHNLNIRRQSLAGEEVEDMQQVLNALAGQYQQIGGTILENKTGLQIDGHEAARVTYTLPMNDASGRPMKLQGYQYLVLADDLWVLTYSTSSKEAAGLEAMFDKSAATFRILR